MNFIQNFIDIRSSSDPQRAIQSISEGVSIRGYNMWLLFCSAVLASIGLDTNSSAVIIGAMLISPLMSPILGVGLSLGIHDETLLIRSLRELGAAVFLSLLASVLFFLISPFDSPTAEIQSRTFPTLLDVLVALFGGIAGIVSASRSGLSNAIPGVAIATALMPPLCTAGYGLATMQWYYFAGAFYLFFINAVFISLATYLIVKYLQFPAKEFRSGRQRRHYITIFLFIIVVVTIPSIYFLYSVYQRQTIKEKLDKLVLIPITEHGNEILKWELAEKDTATLIKIYHSGRPLTDSFKNKIQQSLKANHMKKYELKPIRVNMTKEEVNALSADVSRQMFQQLQLEYLSNEKNNHSEDTLSYTQLTREASIAFPFVDTLYNGWLMKPDTLSKIDTIPIVFYKTKRRVTRSQQAQLYQFLKVRLTKDTLALIRQ